MTWRLHIRHTTAYDYAEDVVASYNEVRITPLTTLGQVTIDADVEVTPPARPIRYWDYWGTLVHAFDVHVPHRRLVVVGSSVVETPATHDPPDGRTIGWAELADDDVIDEHVEFLTPTVSTAATDELAMVADGLRAIAATPRNAIGLVSSWLRDSLTYEKGTTSVSTSAAEAWKSGRGVCQDFVHLAITLLRAMGIPARYASGYFYSDAGAKIGDTVHGESHAWCEAWIGAWWPFDPTNAVPVGERHVVVARGRDYRDVPPLKGIFSGTPSTTTAVLVELTRLA